MEGGAREEPGYGLTSQPSQRHSLHLPPVQKALMAFPSRGHLKVVPLNPVPCTGRGMLALTQAFSAMNWSVPGWLSGYHMY